MTYFPRQVEAQVLEYAKYFKVILLVGARQVGKSTLLSKLFPNYRNFVFDPTQDLYGARKDPDLFLNTYDEHPIILDEIQYVPQLLSSIKRKVDQSAKKGQYFLTGSQNLSMLKTIAESMAGRVGIIDVNAFSYHELTKQLKHNWLHLYLNKPDQLVHLTMGPKEPKYALKKCLWRGGMPGLLQMPDKMVPQYFRSYVSTYLERDVRLMDNIRDIAEFDQFLSLLGALTAQEINYSQLGREVGISPATARAWLTILSRTYQWFELSPFVGNAIKRLSGKKKGYIQDSGVACYLQKVSSPDALMVNPLKGAIFESWVVAQIRKLILNLDIAPNLFHWRTSGGAEVDLVLEIDQKLFPIEIKCKSMVKASDTRGIRAFVDTYAHSHTIGPGLVIYAGEVVYAVNEFAYAIPWNAL